MKPYRSTPIHDCGEPLVTIPQDKFVFFTPHPYMAVGAPYGDTSPWMLRSGVLAAFEGAQNTLQTLRPGWKLMPFDALRPNAVQAFMVEREFAIQAKLAGLNTHPLSGSDRESLAPKVFRLWAIPSDDPAHPPPHSTGAVIDTTLADENGREVDMGSPVDENSDRSNPDHFINATEPHLKAAHANRELLNHVMTSHGFVRNPSEWWHFSLGDQYWTFITHNAKHPESPIPARYGRADLIKPAA